MAVDTKLTGATALTAHAGADIIYIVDDPGGTPLSRKMTIANLFTLSSSETLTITDVGLTGTTTKQLIVTGKTLTSGGTDDVGLEIVQTLNDTGAAGGSDVYTGFKVNITETDVTGWDTKLLADLQIGGTTKFNVNSLGDVTIASGRQIIASKYLSTGNNTTMVIQTRAFSVADNAIEMAVLTATNSSGQFNAVAITPTYNQTSTGAATDLLINRTETAVGSGAQRYADFQSGGTTDFFFSTTATLGMLETAEPTAVTNYGQIYCKNDNKLYFQDGAGTEHEVAFV